MLKVDFWAFADGTNEIIKKNVKWKNNEKRKSDKMENAKIKMENDSLKLKNEGVNF